MHLPTYSYFSIGALLSYSVFVDKCAQKKENALIA